MYFYVSALGLLTEFAIFFQDLNFGAAVFHSETRALHMMKRKRFLPDCGPRVLSTDNK